MNTTLIICDDFTPNPDEIRASALAAGFGNVTHHGTEFEGVGQSFNPGISPLVEALVGFKIVPQIEFFRCTLKDHKLNSLVHADHICAEFASVLYLNPPELCAGGTAFWKHKRHEWDCMPTKDEISKAGYETMEAFGKQMWSDWNDESAWDMDGLACMKYNRFITYPTRRFHSRFPFQSFGDTTETARLVHVMFYDRKK